MCLLCSICLERLCSGSCKSLECGHTFHTECIACVFSCSPAKCPSCRQLVHGMRKLFVSDEVCLMGDEHQRMKRELAEYEVKYDAGYQEYLNLEKRFEEREIEKRELEERVKKSDEYKAKYDALYQDYLNLEKRFEEREIEKRELEERVKKSEEYKAKYEAVCRNYSSLEKRTEGLRKREKMLYEKEKENCGAIVQSSARDPLKVVQNPNNIIHAGVKSAAPQSKKPQSELCREKEKSRKEVKADVRAELKKEQREDGAVALRRKHPMRKCRERAVSYKE